MAYSEYPDNFKDVHKAFTIAAAVIAILYFVAYHFYLKPKCAAPVHLPPDPAPAVIQSKYILKIYSMLANETLTFFCEVVHS